VRQIILQQLLPVFYQTKAVQTLPTLWQIMSPVPDVVPKESGIHFLPIPYIQNILIYDAPRCSFSHLCNSLYIYYKCKTVFSPLPDIIVFIPKRVVLLPYTKKVRLKSISTYVIIILYKLYKNPP